jgi:NtrC-family two-component system response regulator AlgB
MPPLRDRPRDMLRFAEHYLKHAAAQCASGVKGFTPAAEELLRRYPWPGNLRELNNTIERAVILASGPRIDVSDFPLELRMKPSGGDAAGEDLRAGAMVSLQQLEDQHIRRIIEHCPNLNEAADILGIDQATLYRKRVKMGLKHKPGEEKVSPASGENPGN